jgi:hypothetical protein
MRYHHKHPFLLSEKLHVFTMANSPVARQRLPVLDDEVRAGGEGVGDAAHLLDPRRPCFIVAGDDEVLLLHAHGATPQRRVMERLHLRIKTAMNRQVAPVQCSAVGSGFRQPMACYTSTDMETAIYRCFPQRGAVSAAAYWLATNEKNFCAALSLSISRVRHLPLDTLRRKACGGAWQCWQGSCFSHRCTANEQTWHR